MPTASSQPRGIASGPDGALWFTEGAGNKVGRLATAGTFTEFPIPTAGSRPEGITTGPDGNLWFAEGIGNKIGRITTAGVITEFPLPLLGSEPRELTIGPDGAIWFTENGRIGRITTTGIVTELPVPATDAGPRGIVTGPDGALWFTAGAGVGGPGGPVVGRITTGGTVTEYEVSPNPGLITVGPDGALWFTASVCAGCGVPFQISAIERIDTSGDLAGFPTPTAGGFPFGLVTGPDHRIWFTESGASKIGALSAASVAVPVFSTWILVLYAVTLAFFGLIAARGGVR